MKRYKNPWPKIEEKPNFQWPKDSSSVNPPKEEKKVEKQEDIHVQIDARTVANMISAELKKEKKGLSLKDDKVLFFLMLSMGFLGIFVIIIAIISLIITIQSSNTINKLVNILR